MRFGVWGVGFMVWAPDNAPSEWAPRGKALITKPLTSSDAGLWCLGVCVSQKTLLGVDSVDRKGPAFSVLFPGFRVQSPESRFQGAGSSV